MKTGHTYNINNSRYIKTLGPVVSVATDNALAPAEQVVDDTFKYKKGSTLEWNRDNVPGANDDQSQYLINRILRDHLLNVEAGNFSGNVTIGGNLTVNGEYKKLPIATTTKYGITRLASGTSDTDNNDVVTVGMLNAVKDLLMGPGNTPALDTILELAEAIGDPEQAQSILGRLAYLEECCEEVHSLLNRKYHITYNLDHATSSNDTTQVPFINPGYETTITNTYGEAKGNAFSTLTVTMGDIDITEDVVTYDEDSNVAYIDIRDVTDSIVITATANEIYHIECDGCNISGLISGDYFDDASYDIYKNSNYFAHFDFLPAAENILQDYTLGLDAAAVAAGFTFTKNVGNVLTAMNVGRQKVKSNGNYTITFTPRQQPSQSYTIRKDLDHVTFSNTQSTIESGGNYISAFTVDPGYVLRNQDIIVTNTDTSEVVYSVFDASNNLRVPNVSCNITIYAHATQQTPSETTYTITRNYTSGQVTLTETGNTNDTITAGSPYSVSAAPESGYQIESMTVTQGGSSVAVSNNSATINSVSGNIVVTVTSSAVQEPIPEALQGVSKITIKENKNKLYSGELDIRTSTVNGARQDILPRQYEGSSRGYGVTNGDGTYYFKNGEYHIGGHLYEDEMCVIYIYMNQNNSGNIYDAMDWVFGQIDSYNNLQVTNDTKVCYSSTNATNDARIMVYPIKYNPGAPRTIEVPLGVPAGITVDNNHIGGGSTIYVNQDKSRAIYEIVDENDNVIPFEFGNGTFAQQAGIGNATTTTGITDQEFEAAFGWNCDGQFGINTAGTYTFKLRVFGIASRPLYDYEWNIPTAYNNDKDMYRYILGDVDITTADPVTGDAVVTPFRCSITSERSNTSITYTPYASITGTGTNNEFVQTSVADQGGDTIRIWDLRNRTYGYSQSGTFTEGNCVEIPFVLTITDPVGNSGGLAIFCKLVDGQGRTLTSVYSPIMKQDVYSAYALVWNYDKTQIARRRLSEINDWMVEKGSEFNAEFYPQSGYSITDVTLAYNGNQPQTVATQTITIDPVEGPIEITITSAAA